MSICFGVVGSWVFVSSERKKVLCVVLVGSLGLGVVIVFDICDGNLFEWCSFSLFFWTVLFVLFR